MHRLRNILRTRLVEQIFCKIEHTPNFTNLGLKVLDFPRNVVPKEFVWITAVKLVHLPRQKAKIVAYSHKPPRDEIPVYGDRTVASGGLNLFICEPYRLLECVGAIGLAFVGS